MKKRVSILLVFVMVLLTAVSCQKPDAEPKNKIFNSNGMTITLTDEFHESSYQGYTACYESSKVAVFVLKESFSLQEGFEDFTLDEYAELVLQSNSSKSPSAISKKDGLTSMEYKFFNENTNQTYKYFSVMYKGPDAFWLVQFACVENIYDAQKDSFVTWAKTVKFDS